MEKTKSTLRQLFAGVLTITFIISSHTLPPAYAAEAKPPAHAPKLLPADLGKVTLPAEIGKVAEFHRAQGGRLVILIQDAHAVPDAQASIRRTIRYFEEEYGIRQVALEGASAKLDPQIFRSFPDKERLKEVFEDYHDQGELAAGTAASIFSNSKALYHGIEDWALYEEGLALYLQAMEKEPEILKALERERQRSKEAKRKTYSKELFEIDGALEKFNENNAHLLEVLKKLSEAKAPSQGSELALLLGEARRNPETLQSVEIEVKNLAQKVKSFLKEKSRSGDVGARPASPLLRQFNTKHQEFLTSRITPEAFALWMKELISEWKGEARLAPTVKVSARLASLMKKQKRLRDIQGTRLFDDFEAYARSVKESLFRNEEERVLDEESREIQLLMKLARLELTREEWEELKASGLASFGDQASDRRDNKPPTQSRDKLSQSKETLSPQASFVSLFDDSGGQIATATTNNSISPTPITTFQKRFTAGESQTDTKPIPTRISKVRNKDREMAPLRIVPNIRPTLAEAREDVKYKFQLFFDINAFSANLAFYGNAEARDRAFLKNLLNLETRNSQLETLLVAGGFHAEGLIEQFKEKGISYLLVMPQIDSVPGETNYRAHMQGQVSWREYFTVENGKINLYNAFVRGTRDRLLSSLRGGRKADEAISSNSEIASVASLPRNDGPLLKRWRDQIIRDLADQNRIESAGKYTRFIDELNPSSLRGPEGRSNLLAKVEHFIAGLKQLESQGRLNEQNILKLLQPSAIPEIVVYGSLSRAEMRVGNASPLRFDPETHSFLPAPARPAGRAEVRDEKGAEEMSGSSDFGLQTEVDEDSGGAKDKKDEEWVNDYIAEFVGGEIDGVVRAASPIPNRATPPTGHRVKLLSQYDAFYAINSLVDGQATITLGERRISSSKLRRAVRSKTLRIATTTNGKATGPTYEVVRQLDGKWRSLGRLAPYVAKKPKAAVKSPAQKAPPKAKPTPAMKVDKAPAKVPEKKKPGFLEKLGIAPPALPRLRRPTVGEVTGFAGVSASAVGLVFLMSGVFSWGLTLITLGGIAAITGASLINIAGQDARRPQASSSIPSVKGKPSVKESVKKKGTPGKQLVPWKVALKVAVFGIVGGGIGTIIAAFVAFATATSVPVVHLGLLAMIPASLAVVIGAWAFDHIQVTKPVRKSASAAKTIRFTWRGKETSLEDVLKAVVKNEAIRRKGLDNMDQVLKVWIDDEEILSSGLDRALVSQSKEIKIRFSPRAEVRTEDSDAVGEFEFLGGEVGLQFTLKENGEAVLKLRGPEGIFYEDTRKVENGGEITFGKSPDDNNLPLLVGDLPEGLAQAISRRRQLQLKYEVGKDGRGRWYFKNEGRNPARYRGKDYDSKIEKEWQRVTPLRHLKSYWKDGSEQLDRILDEARNRWILRGKQDEVREGASLGELQWLSGELDKIQSLLNPDDLRFLPEDFVGSLAGLTSSQFDKIRKKVNQAIQKKAAQARALVLEEEDATAPLSGVPPVVRPALEPLPPGVVAQPYLPDIIEEEVAPPPSEKSPERFLTRTRIVAMALGIAAAALITIAAILAVRALTPRPSEEEPKVPGIEAPKEAPRRAEVRSDETSQMQDLWLRRVDRNHGIRISGEVRKGRLILKAYFKDDPVADFSVDLQDDSSPVIPVGRGVKESGLEIPSLFGWISRFHAEINYGKGKFWARDGKDGPLGRGPSLNGTYLSDNRKLSHEVFEDITSVEPVLQKKVEVYGTSVTLDEILQDLESEAPMTRGRIYYQKLVPEDQASVRKHLSFEARKRLDIRNLITKALPEILADEDEGVTGALEGRMAVEQLDELQKRVFQVGQDLDAHGAGDSIFTFLQLILEGTVRSKITHTGPLTDGPPEIVAGPHGPYYVVFSDPQSPAWNQRENHRWYLVPEDSDRRVIEQILRKAVDAVIPTFNVSTNQEILDKVLTYESFIAHHRAEVRVKTSTKSDYFFADGSDYLLSRPNIPAIVDAVNSETKKGGIYKVDGDGFTFYVRPEGQNQLWLNLLEMREGKYRLEVTEFEGDSQTMKYHTTIEVDEDPGTAEALLRPVLERLSSSTSTSDVKASDLLNSFLQENELRIKEAWVKDILDIVHGYAGGKALTKSKLNQEKTALDIALFDGSSQVTQETVENLARFIEGLLGFLPNTILTAPVRKEKGWGMRILMDQEEAVLRRKADGTRTGSRVRSWQKPLIVQDGLGNSAMGFVSIPSYLKNGYTIEDTAVLDPESNLAAVADGVSAADFAKLSSMLTTRAVAEAVSSSKPTVEDTRKAFLQGLSNAANQMRTMRDEMPRREDGGLSESGKDHLFGTTFSGVRLVQDPQTGDFSAVIANLGDSNVIEVRPDGSAEVLFKAEDELGRLREKFQLNSLLPEGEVEEIILAATQFIVRKAEPGTRYFVVSDGVRYEKFESRDQYWLFDDGNANEPMTFLEGFGKRSKASSMHETILDFLRLLYLEEQEDSYRAWSGWRQDDMSVAALEVPKGRAEVRAEKRAEAGSQRTGAGTAAPTGGLCVAGDTKLPVIRGEERSKEVKRQRGKEAAQALQRLLPEGEVLWSLSKTEREEGKEALIPQAPLHGPPAREIPIVEAKPGDYVLSLNEQTRQIEPRRILALLDMGTKPVWRLTTASGRSIKTTANHPYLTRPSLRSAASSGGEAVSDLPAGKAGIASASLGTLPRNDAPARWVKVSKLRVGDEIAVPGELPLKGLGGMTLLNNTNFPASNDDQRAVKEFRRGFGKESREAGGDRFNGQRLQAKEDNARIASQGESVDIGKIGVESEEDPIFPAGGVENILIRGISQPLFPGPRDVKAPKTKLFYDREIETLVGEKFQLGEVLGEDLFVFDKPHGIVNRRLNVLWGQLGITIPQDAFGRVAGFNQFENEIDRDTGSLDAGLAKANVRINRDSLLQRLVSHLSSLRIKTYHGLSRLSSQGLVSLVSLLRLPAAYAQTAAPPLSSVLWDRIVSIEYAGREPVFDIEVEGTHNFIGNGIFAHNTALPGQLPGSSVDQGSFSSAQAVSFPRAEVRAEQRSVLMPYSETLIDWQKEFANDYPLVVLIGPGPSEELLGQAQFYSSRNMNVVAIERQKEFADESLEKAVVSNVRLVLGDAKKVIPSMFGDSGVAEILVLFPNPHQPEVFGPQGESTLPAEAFKKLKPGGRLIVVTEDKMFSKKLTDLFKTSKSPAGTNIKTGELVYGKENRPEEVLGITLTGSRRYFPDSLSPYYYLEATVPSAGAQRDAPAEDILERILEGDTQEIPPRSSETEKVQAGDAEALAAAVRELVRHIHGEGFKAILMSGWSSLPLQILLEEAWPKLYPVRPLPPLFIFDEEGENKILYRTERVPPEQVRKLLEEKASETGESNLKRWMGGRGRVVFMDDGRSSGAKHRQLLTRAAPFFSRWPLLARIPYVGRFFSQLHFAFFTTSPYEGFPLASDFKAFAASRDASLLFGWNDRLQAMSHQAFGKTNGSLREQLEDIIEALSGTESPVEGERLSRAEVRANKKWEKVKGWIGRRLEGYFKAKGFEREGRLYEALGIKEFKKAFGGSIFYGKLIDEIHNFLKEVEKVKPSQRLRTQDIVTNFISWLREETRPLRKGEEIKRAHLERIDRGMGLFNQFIALTKTAELVHLAASLPGLLTLAGLLWGGSWLSALVLGAVLLWNQYFVFLERYERFKAHRIQNRLLQRIPESASGISKTLPRAEVREGEPTFKQLPSEWNWVREKLIRAIQLQNFEQWYGVDSESEFYQLYHGTTAGKLFDISREGMKTFPEKEYSQPRIYVTTSPTLALWHAIENGPHDTLRKEGKVPDTGTNDVPVLLVLKVPKAWLKEHPDSKKPLDLPDWLKGAKGITADQDTRLSAFMKTVRDELDELSQGREASDFGIPFPVDSIPQQFISVMDPKQGRTEIPIRDYLERVEPSISRVGSMVRRAEVRAENTTRAEVRVEAVAQKVVAIVAAAGTKTKSRPDLDPKRIAEETASVLRVTPFSDFVDRVRSEARLMLNQIEEAQVVPVTLRITKPLADAELSRLTTLPILQALEGKLAIAFDKPAVGESFMEAFRQMRGRFGYVFLSEEMVKGGLDQTLLKGLLGFRTVDDFGRFRTSMVPNIVDNTKAVPVVVDELTTVTYLKGEAPLFGMGTKAGDIEGEPYLEVVEEVVKILGGLVVASLIKNPAELLDPAKRSEIQAALIKELFNEKADPSIITIEDSNFSVDRSALMRFILAEQASRAEIRKAA